MARIKLKGISNKKYLPVNSERVDHDWPSLLGCRAAQAFYEHEYGGGLFVLDARIEADLNEVPENGYLGCMLGVKGSYNLIKTGLLVASELIAGLSQHFKHSSHLRSDAVREQLLQLKGLLLLVACLEAVWATAISGVALFSTGILVFNH